MRHHYLRSKSSIFPFLDESVTRGRTDRPTDRRTDGRTDRPSYRDARTHLKTGKSMILIANNDVSCNHIIIQSFHHHEDASLALWALLLENPAMQHRRSPPHRSAGSARVVLFPFFLVKNRLFTAPMNSQCIS